MIADSAPVGFSSLPYVHTNGLTVDSPHVDNFNQSFLFKGSEAHRAEHILTLQHYETDSRTTKRGLECGEDLWVAYSESRDAYSLRRSCCGHRLCPACGPIVNQRKADLLLRKFPKKIEKNEIKFITLTLSSENVDLSAQLQRLTKCFRKLRQTRLWRKTVLYGAASIEVTLNPETHLWHPHIHVVARAHYIPWAELRDCWLTATGDSSVVDVKAARSRQGVIGYVLKYATKGFDLDHLLRIPNAYQHLYVALRRKRTFIQFGNWPEPWKPRDLSDQKPNDWRFVGYVDKVFNDPSRHADISRALLVLLRRQRVVTTQEAKRVADEHSASQNPPTRSPWSQPRPPTPS